MNLFLRDDDGLRMPRDEGFFFFKLTKIRYFLWSLIELKLFFEVSWIIFFKSCPGVNTFQLEGVDEQCETCSGDAGIGINGEGSMRV